MKKKKELILAAICCGFVLLFSACQLVDNLHDYKQGENGDIPEPEEQVVQQPLTIGEAAEEKEDAAAEQAQPAVGEQVEIELYFMNSDGSALEKETRTIPKEEGIARATLEQLIAGPKTAALTPTLAPDTVVNGINIANGVCTVDLGRGSLSHAEDTDDRRLALYSIVDTMCQFAAVDKVRVLEDGEALSVPDSGADASQALAPVY